MRNIATIKSRILEYLDYKMISKYECYQQTGITNGVFSKKEGLSEDNLLRFISYYSDVNSDWLLTGKGEMLKKNEKKSENFADENVHPLEQKKMSTQCGKMSTHCVPPTQYDPNDGLTHDFSAEPYSDQQQINTLNKFIAELQRALEQKNELLAAKDELLKSKDQTIAAQTASLKLLEGQMNATTALIEELTRLMGNETKKRSERADARDASDADARR